MSPHAAAGSEGIVDCLHVSSAVCRDVTPSYFVFCQAVAAGDNVKVAAKCNPSGSGCNTVGVEVARLRCLLTSRRPK